MNRTQRTPKLRTAIRGSQKAWMVNVTPFKSGSSSLTSFTVGGQIIKDSARTYVYAECKLFL